MKKLFFLYFVALQMATAYDRELFEKEAGDPLADFNNNLYFFDSLFGREIDPKGVTRMVLTDRALWQFRSLAEVIEANPELQSRSKELEEYKRHYAEQKKELVAEFKRSPVFNLKTHLKITSNESANNLLQNSESLEAYRSGLWALGSSINQLMSFATGEFPSPSPLDHSSIPQIKIKAHESLVRFTKAEPIQDNFLELAISSVGYLKDEDFRNSQTNRMHNWDLWIANGKRINPLIEKSERPTLWVEEYMALSYYYETAFVFRMLAPREKAGINLTLAAHLHNFYVDFQKLTYAATYRNDVGEWKVTESMQKSYEDTLAAINQELTTITQHEKSRKSVRDAVLVDFASGKGKCMTSVDILKTKEREMQKTVNAFNKASKEFIDQVAHLPIVLEGKDFLKFQVNYEAVANFFIRHGIQAPIK